MVKLQTLAKGVAVGRKEDRGFPTTKRAVPKSRAVSNAKSKRRQFVKSVIRDTVGFAPYERRIMDLLKLGNSKRALKLAKARLGTHKRALTKRSQMEQQLMK